YAAAAHQGPTQILFRLQADLRRALRQRPELQVAVVQDGAPELWNLMRELLGRLGVTNWIARIDRYHAVEHMAHALEILQPDAQRRAATLQHWRHLLDTRDDAIHLIRRSLNSMSTRRPGA